MKRLIPVFLLLMLLALPVGHALASVPVGPATIAFEPSLIAGEVGQSLRVALVVDNSTPEAVLGVQLLFEYDPAYISFVQLFDGSDCLTTCQSARGFSTVDPAGPGRYQTTSIMPVPLATQPTLRVVELGFTIVGDLSHAPDDLITLIPHVSGTDGTMYALTDVSYRLFSTLGAAHPMPITAFAQTAISVTEATTSPITVTLAHLNGNRAYSGSVSVQRIGGTASPNVDYTLANTALTWTADGNGGVTLALDPVINALPDLPPVTDEGETVVLQLVGASRNMVIGSQDTITITLRDAAAPAAVTMAAVGTAGGGSTLSWLVLLALVGVTLMVRRNGQRLAPRQQHRPPV